MRAETTMTRDVIAVSPQLLLATAYRIMQEWGVRHVPVTDHGKVVGILSDRDIYRRSHADGDQPVIPEITVEMAMSLRPICCSKDAKVPWLAETMVAGKIDAIPVIDNDDNLLGLVTSTDLLALIMPHAYGDAILPFEYLLKNVDDEGNVTSRGQPK